MMNSKAILTVRFESTYGSNELLNLFHQNMEDYKNVYGLLKKYYLSDEKSATVGNIFLFENRAARAAFCISDLPKAILATVSVKIETLSVEELEVTNEMSATVTAQQKIIRYVIPWRAIILSKIRAQISL